MTIFNFINDILYKKTGKLLNKKENESVFQSYMLSRWMSMYSGNIARLLNLTINRLYKSLETVDQRYKLYLTTVPIQKFKKINYIKKVKVEETEELLEKEEQLNFLAESMKISKREIREYLSQTKERS